MTDVDYDEESSINSDGVDMYCYNCEYNGCCDGDEQWKIATTFLIANWLESPFLFPLGGGYSGFLAS
jgi:hypothetical protein